MATGNTELMRPFCTCTYIQTPILKGWIVASESNCAIHENRPYPCDHKCGCNNYRPRSEPTITPSGNRWPLCVCGHIAQEHN